jgi:hypothetical protein
MKISIAAAALTLATAAWMTGAGTANADSGNNDPAHMCLDGLQWDYYQVVSGDPKDIDFGGLVHGFDEVANADYVQADDHDQCVAFAAKNKSNGSSTPHVSEIVITKTMDVATP